MSGPVLLRSDFCVRAERVDESFVLHLRGELDMATTPLLRRALAEATANDAAEVVLDLASLSFVDSSGVKAFLAAWHHIGQQGRSFRPLHARGLVLKTLRLTSLDRLLAAEAPLPQRDRTTSAGLSEVDHATRPDHVTFVPCAS